MTTAAFEEIKRASEARRARTYEVDVPEWGRKVFFKALSLIETDRMKQQSPTDDESDLAATMVIMKALDENGERLFPDDIHARAWLLEEHNGVLKRVVEAMQDPTDLDAEKNA